MTIQPTPRTKTKRDHAAAAREETEDIIDRFIAKVRAEFPDAKPDILTELADGLRAEFKGSRPYIRSTAADAKAHQLQKFRNIFNGTNVATCARELGVGRATVYRLIKTAGK